MPEPGERKKPLGTGLMEEAREGITRRNEALREAADDEPHEEGTRRHNRRVDVDKKG